MAPLTKRRGRARNISMNSAADLRGMRSNRLQPNEPLHMTTRAAAASVTASVASADSSRSSVGEPSRSVGGDDIDVDRPAKVARVSPRQSTSHSQISPPSQDASQYIKGEEETSQDHELLNPEATSNEEMVDDASDGRASEMSGNDQYDTVTESVEPQTSNGGLKPATNPRAAKATISDERLSATPSRNLGPTVKTRSTDRQSQEPDEAGGLLKRMPGRRRAPHPDVDIEVDLRRQLELKVAYRAVVKALKPILMELAERTKRELETNHEAHKQFSEFDDVTKELDARLQQRMSMLTAELSEDEARLERELEYRKEVAKKTFDFALRDSRDDYLLRCQNRFLTVLRDAENEEDSDATEYEDGIVPNLYHIHPDGSRTVLPDGYDSRSRFFVETEHKWADSNVRHDFRKEQQEFEETSLVRKPSDFAVYDGDQRAIGVANFNLRQLRRATIQVEQDKDLAAKRLANAPAAGLLTLANATTMMGPLIKQPDPKPWIDMSGSQNIMQPYQILGPNGYIEGSKADSANTSAKQRTPRRRRRSPRSLEMLNPISSISGSYPNTQPSTATQQNTGAPYYPPSQNPATTAPSSRAHNATSPRAQPFLPFGSYPTHQKLDPTSPRPAPVAMSNPPSQNHEYDRSQPDSRSPTSLEPSKQYRRRRPGPRAFYAGDEPKSNQPSSHVWEPFTNTMGPPTYLPNYVKTAEFTRQNSSASTSPITPVNLLPSAPRSGNEWPGFSSNTTVGGPNQATGFDSRIGQNPSFPSMPSAFPASSGPPMSRPTTGNENSTAHSPTLRWGRVNSPEGHQAEPRQQPHPPPPPTQPPPHAQPQSQQPPPIFPAPHNMTGYYQPNNFYGPFQPQMQGQHPASRPPFNPPSSSGTPLLPHPFYFQNTQGSPRSTTEQSPRMAPGAASPQAHDPSKQQPWQSREYHNRSQSQAHTPSNFAPLAPRTPLPPIRQDQMQHFPGQTGHQRILPATLDPNRRSVRPSESLAGTPPEGPPSASSTILSQSQQHGLFPAFATVPQPPTHQLQSQSNQPRQASPTEASQRQSQHASRPLSASASATPASARHASPQTRNDAQQHHSQQQQQQQRHPQYGWHHYANILPAPQNESAVARRDREAEAHEKEMERKEKEWKFSRSRYG